MELTKKQIETIKPLVRQAILARATSWDAQRQIEKILGQEFDSMDAACETFAVEVPAPAVTPDLGCWRTTDEMVRDFIEACED